MLMNNLGLQHLPSHRGLDYVRPRRPSHLNHIIYGCSLKYVLLYLQYVCIIGEILEGLSPPGQSEAPDF